LKKIKKAIKGPGFYTPMDIAPGEYSVEEEYKKLRQDIVKLIERDYGKRCNMKDTEDFPELIGKTELSEGRCGVCFVYETFDKFWKAFGLDDD